MLNTIIRRAALAGGLLFVTSAASVAQPLDKRVIFSFSGPVTLPGVTLPTGTYLFRVPSPNRNIIQVLSPDGTKVYGTFFAIPAHRNGVHGYDDAVVESAHRCGGPGPVASRSGGFVGIVFLGWTTSGDIFPRQVSPAVGRAHGPDVKRSDPPGVRGLCGQPRSGRPADRDD